MKSNSKNELINLLSTCGQIAEHKSQKMIEHDMDEDNLLKSLTQAEKDSLYEILSKLKN